MDILIMGNNIETEKGARRIKYVHQHLSENIEHRVLSMKHCCVVSWQTYQQCTGGQGEGRKGNLWK
jgi:hypothetical protein